MVALDENDGVNLYNLLLEWMQNDVELRGIQSRVTRKEIVFKNEFMRSGTMTWRALSLLFAFTLVLTHGRLIAETRTTDTR